MLTLPSRRMPGRPRRWTVPAILIAALAGSVTSGGLAVAGLGDVSTAQAAASTEVKYAATEDAYVSSARPTYRFGNSASLVAGAAKADQLVSYVKVKVAALPAGSSVARAELRIMRETKAWPATVRVKRVASSAWSETTLDWRNRPLVGDTLATVQPAPTAAELRFDLSATVRSAGTYTFAVTSPATNDIARFRSSEYGWQGPRLFLTLNSAPTTPPVTPTATPSASPSATASPTEPPPTEPADCVVDANLVPSCGLLWGAAAGGFSETPRDEALKIWDAKAGRSSTVYHTYHRGDELFPTADERAMARDPASPRILMLNWKVGYGTTWSNVAAGGQDARIDRLAAHLRANFTEKFFMVLHHEPENDVDQTAGSGMTARDYAAMFRHTVLRLKAQGVGNGVFVMAYMNYEKWNNSPWWYDLYPGDDVVDWLGLDSYINAEPAGYHDGDFRYLMDRTTDPAAFPGWYTWATTKHPGKPIVLAEWAVYDSSSTVVPANKAALFDTVAPQLKDFPALKGLVYFDTASDQSGKDMRIDSSPAALEAFRRLAADPRFDVKLR